MTIEKPIPTPEQREMWRSEFEKTQGWSPVEFATWDGKRYKYDLLQRDWLYFQLGFQAAWSAAQPRTTEQGGEPNTAGGGVNTAPSIRHDTDGVGSPFEQLKNLQSWYPSKWDIEKALKESRGYNPKEMSLHGIRTLRILADIELARQNAAPHQSPGSGSAAQAGREASAQEQLLESMQQTKDAILKRLKTAIGALRSIAYGDASTWPNCSSREVAKQGLLDCGGEKYAGEGGDGVGVAREVPSSAPAPTVADLDVLREYMEITNDMQRHMHWLCEGGEFAHDMEKGVMMSMASHKEYQQARDMLKDKRQRLHHLNMQLKSYCGKAE